MSNKLKKKNPNRQVIKKKSIQTFQNSALYKYTANFQTFTEERKKKEMHACTMFLLPWGSLVEMEFSDPETKPSPNQLADIHMHTFELLITESNSTSQGGVSSLKMSQAVKSQNVLLIRCFRLASTLQCLASVSK